MNEPAVTITFFMKFYGFVPTTYFACPKIFSLNKDTKFCFDFSLKTFFFYYLNQAVFKEMTFNNYLGEWMFVSVSNYK